ncbi:MAG TPA: biopolymer transporter ExbD [Candidatus Saccharimonadaceae bacterium]|jgi:biopolymer transport protein ExbD|nr:biopolymer transporter ExbD [Candidatus Saccharimonadaceae bacterium]
MKRNRRSSDSMSGINEPNMTPLIDVSLVLVVILMVATPLALQSGIGVSSASSTGKKAAPSHTDRVEVSLLSADSIVVNRQLVHRDRLALTLHEVLAESATRQVVVRCADNVPHGDFVAVLDEARAQGAAEIAVAGR